MIRGHNFTFKMSMLRVGFTRPCLRMTTYASGQAQESAGFIRIEKYCSAAIFVSKASDFSN